MKQLVVAFASSTDALRAEELCRAQNLEGRLIPLPPDIQADCGLAWRTPLSLREKTERALAGHIVPEGCWIRDFRW